MELDWCVGELRKTLDRLKLTDNTLIVFCSDNGPVLDDGYKDEAVEKLGDHKPAGPFSGGKYSVLEGGTRTPFITHWPGRIKPGVSSEVVCTIDLCSSLAALTGVDVSSTACLDSFNVLGALLGEDGSQGRAHLLQQDNGQSGSFGLRSGDWKLVRRRAGKGPRADWQYSLYNLANDPGEQTVLNKQHPEILERLTAQLTALIDSGRSRP